MQFLDSEEEERLQFLKEIEQELLAIQIDYTIDEIMRDVEAINQLIDYNISKQVAE